MPNTYEEKSKTTSWDEKHVEMSLRRIVSANQTGLGLYVTNLSKRVDAGLPAVTPFVYTG